MHKDGQTPRYQVEAIKQEFMAKFQEKLVAQNDPSLESCDKSSDIRIQIPLGEYLHLLCSTLIISYKNGLHIRREALNFSLYGVPFKKFTT